MLFRKRSSPNPIFQSPIELGPSIVLGAGACIVFYGLMLAGPLNFALIRRYSFSHPMVFAIVGVFFTAIVSLASKWYACHLQTNVCSKVSSALDEISTSDATSNHVETGESNSRFFETLWRSQPLDVTNSWTGQRVTSILNRQLIRKSTKRLELDIHELAERDAVLQNASHGPVRIMTWVMPMLGFLGTAVGLSGTLGQIDAQALSSGSQDAINSLKSGLYLAFDTTTVGLVLTMAIAIAQFAVHRAELALLFSMNDRVSEAMQLCLSEQDKQPGSNQMESALHQVTKELTKSVQQIVQTQSELWQQTISTAHGYWQNMTATSAEMVQASMASAIESALAKHNESLSRNTDQLAKVQAEGAVLIDSRWQQWQTTLSEQARAVHQQRRDMKEQTELLNRLIEKHDAVRSMEMPLQATLERLTDVDRFHDAAICLTEAVAVLGTQMERYGYLGRQPVRRKSADPISAEPISAESTPNVPEAELPTILPLKRRAG